jgi:hypothetical protein
MSDASRVSSLSSIIKSPVLQSGRAHRILIAVVAILLPAAARASSPQTLTVGSDIEFSGGQAPASPIHPWIVMTVTDNGPNSVLFQLSAPNLTGSENVSEFDFNLDPALSMDLGNLVFSSLVKTGSFDTPTITQGENAFKADGDGDYDISLSFTTGGNVNKTFTNGDTLEYTVTGNGISAASFDFLSNPDGGHGPFITAAHIQNTTGAGNGGSGWIADSTGGRIVPHVPEPSSLLLGALGLLGIGVPCWRRTRASRATSAC